MAQDARPPAADRAQPYHVAAMILGAASIAFRLFLIWGYLPRLFDTENMRTGFALAARGTLADPFILPTGATAHVAPLYPALIAAGARVTGDIELGLLVARSLLALGFGAFIACLPVIAEWCGFRRNVGLLAAVAFAFPAPPVFMWIEVSGQHETVLTTILFAFATAATMVTLRRRELTAGRGALLGALWGVAAHSSPVVAPPLVALLATAWLLFGLSRRSLTVFAVTLLAALMVTVTPWTIRNARVIGGFSFIRDNFGLELAVSNSDDASPDMRENMAGTMTRHPYFHRGEAARMQEVGERRYYQQRSAEAKEWIRTHPGRFTELTLHRVRLFFMPRLGLEHHAHFYISVITLSIAWLAIAWRRRSAESMALLAVLLSFAAPHFFVQSSPRYSYPVLWILVLFASSAVLELWSPLAARVQRWHRSRVRA